MLTVPSIWKLSIVVPIFKHGDPSMPDCYRIASLAGLLFQNFGTVGPRPDRRAHFEPAAPISGWLQVESRCPQWVPSSMSCRRGLPPRRMLPSWTPRRRLTRFGWTECELDLQTALDAVAVWGHNFRFEFGVGPTKSTVT